MNYLIETKSPWDGWQPFKVFEGTLQALLETLNGLFPGEMHTVRFKRCKNVAEANEAVTEYWGKA